MPEVTMKLYSGHQVVRRRFICRLGFCLATVAGVFGLAFLAYKAQAAWRFAGYEQVVRDVRSGRLHSDASGDIRLPARLRWLTRDGHVYQSSNQRGVLVLLFPTDVDVVLIDWGDGKVTRKRQIAGYIYDDSAPPKDGWLSFAGLDSVRIWGTERLPPHWWYAEPFYS